MLRAPVWFILLLVLLIFGIGLYAYFTAPLPLGLSGVIRTPGGGNLAPGATPTPPPGGSRTAVGQPLILGATEVLVVAIQRNQDLASTNRGPAGSFTLVQIQIHNDGSEPLTPQPANFRLVDDRGRSYAVDPEATRSVDGVSKRRYLFDATVPPGGVIDTLLAFETGADITTMTLRVTLGYGEVELPR